jgi:pimeloyl-ACP methyl ester carboxylesterase
MGSWIWKDLIAELKEPTLAIDYGDASRTPKKQLSFDDYVEHTVQAIEAWGVESVVLVAHSLSGVIALAVAEKLGAKSAGFVAISATIPKNGGSFLSCLPLPQRLVMSVMMRLVGTRPPDAAIRKSLCTGLSDAAAKEVVERFQPESVGVYVTQCNALTPQCPRLYVTLTNDHNFGLPLQQKMAANLGNAPTAAIDSGHLPMLSKPRELAEILRNFRAGV